MSGTSRGRDYDDQFATRLAGQDAHGEAVFVERAAARLLAPSDERISVLDAGCGTGRVAIELSKRGFEVTGVDIDDSMLEAARQKAPDLSWVVSDIASFRCEKLFSVAVLAGNVMIFVGRGCEEGVVSNLATLIKPNGLLIAGFQLISGGLSVTEYDALCGAAGFAPAERWSTWDGDDWQAESGYSVSVQRRQC